MTLLPEYTYIIKLKNRIVHSFSVFHFTNKKINFQMNTNLSWIKQDPEDDILLMLKVLGINEYVSIW